MKVYLNYEPVGSVTNIADLSSVNNVIVTNANGVLIQARTNNVRFTIDGTNPTASLGLTLIADMQPVLIPVSKGTVIKLIEETASASVDLQLVVTG